MGVRSSCLDREASNFGSALYLCISWGDRVPQPLTAGQKETKVSLCSWAGRQGVGCGREGGA